MTNVTAVFADCRNRSVRLIAAEIRGAVTPLSRTWNGP